MLCLVIQSCLTLCNPVDCSPPGSSVHGDSPEKNTGVGCHALFWGIFPTQGSNPGIPHCRQILYRLSHQGSPREGGVGLNQWISNWGPELGSGRAKGRNFAVPVLPPHVCTKKKKISAFVCFSAQITEGQRGLRGGLEGLSSLWGVWWPMSKRTQ